MQVLHSTKHNLAKFVTLLNPITHLMTNNSTALRLVTKINIPHASRLAADKQ